MLVLPRGSAKASTADVYRAFDARNGAEGFAARRAALLEALADVRRPRDLARLPPNDLAASPLADRLKEAGAFRADVSGAGPCVYGLFGQRRKADAAALALKRCRTHLGDTARVVRLTPTARRCPACNYPEGMTDLLVEHHESEFSRRLRRRKLQVAAGIAAVEAVLLLVGAVPWWLVVVAAVVSVALYVWLGRDHGSPGIRAGTWIAAVSQLIVVLVPVGLVVAGILALVGIVVLAAVALALLLLDRR